MLNNTKPLKKVIKGLKKASKTHAKQARALTKIEKNQRTRPKRTLKKKK